MPDPASGMEMEPEFLRRVEEYVRASAWRSAVATHGIASVAARQCAYADWISARDDIWSWHVAAVERAVTTAIMAERAMRTRLARPAGQEYG